MYEAGRKTSKRIQRKLGEASFDLEVARNTLIDMDYASADCWQDVWADLEEVLVALNEACKLAKDAAGKMPEGTVEEYTDSGLPNNPFAVKKPDPAPPAEKPAEGKHKTAK